jgi:hypothetical protein
MVFMKSSKEADAGIVIRQSGGSGRNLGMHRHGRIQFIKKLREESLIGKKAAIHAMHLNRF